MLKHKGAACGRPLMEPSFPEEGRYNERCGQAGELSREENQSVIRFHSPSPDGRECSPGLAREKGVVVLEPRPAGGVM